MTKSPHRTVKGVCLTSLRSLPAAGPLPPRPAPGAARVQLNDDAASPASELPVATAADLALHHTALYVRHFPATKFYHRAAK